MLFEFSLTLLSPFFTTLILDSVTVVLDSLLPHIVVVVFIILECKYVVNVVPYYESRKTHN